jgi:uncharacterized protein (UPF0147 family)
MGLELITADDYASLPAPPEARFAAFEEICRRSMDRLINDQSSPGFDTQVRQQYMAHVAAAAEEYGIDGLKYPWGDDMDEQAAQSFILQAAGIVTRFRLRSSGEPSKYSVRLASKTRGKIEQQISKLRDLVAESDFPDDLRKKLLRKLDELSVELSQPRVSFAKVFAVLGVVCAALGGTTAFLADAPQAVATITALLGADKVAEDAEIVRLGPLPRPKSLPSVPRALPSPVPDFGQRKRDDLDDEIPF